jgi:uncharacterized glyoxalase superfamily protein PhnB
MSETDTTPAPSCWPCLSYDDAEAALRFLVDAFGFEERLVVRGDADRPIHHAELLWPDGGGVMFGSRQPGGGAFAEQPAGAGSVYVVCTDADAVFERAKGHGATIVVDMEDTDYGNHGFTATDPEGNLWSFGTYRGWPRPEQLQE